MLVQIVPASDMCLRMIPSDSFTNFNTPKFIRPTSASTMVNATHGRNRLALLQRLLIHTYSPVFRSPHLPVRYIEYATEKATTLARTTESRQFIPLCVSL